MSAPLGQTIVPAFVVQDSLLKVVGVGQRLEDAAPRPARRIDLAFSAIFEAQEKTMISDHLHGGHVCELGHGVDVREGADWLGGSPSRASCQFASSSA